MQNKNKSDITNEYSKIQQGPLVGKGNQSLTRTEDIKNNDENFTNSVDSSRYEGEKHDENYGGKEYHGI